jgi:hypothetical protein
MNTTFIRLDKITVEELDAGTTGAIEVQAGLTCRWCGRPILPNDAGPGFSHVRPKYPRAGPGFCGQFRKMAEPIALNPLDADREES